MQRWNQKLQRRDQINHAQQNRFSSLGSQCDIAKLPEDPLRHVASDLRRANGLLDPIEERDIGFFVARPRQHGARRTTIAAAWHLTSLDRLQIDARAPPAKDREVSSGHASSGWAHGVRFMKALSIFQGRSNDSISQRSETS